MIFNIFKIVQHLLNQSLVVLPYSNDPYGNSELLEGDLPGFAVCAALGIPAKPVVPYGTQTEATALWVESGSRRTRGFLTEGRHLIFESTINGQALSVTNSVSTTLSASKPSEIKESNPLQRFVIHYSTGPIPNSLFKISAAGIDGTDQFISSDLAIGSINQAATFAIVGTNVAGGTVYSIQESSGSYLSVGNGVVSLRTDAMRFNVYSVTF